ncbi:MAG: prolyl oligopeptidase family serine peptidase, partial [Myxococcales bacterium]|nr:prolyl oligopeptidase family serine peptidase [Myxococcales bacterium]
MRIVVLFVLVCVGCPSQMSVENTTVVDGLASRGIDAEELLAPPTDDELEAVRADWRTRDVEARDVRVEARFELPGDQVMLVISHATPAGRHVGGVLAPAAALEEDAARPVLLQLHGLGRALALELPDPASAPPGSAPTDRVTAWPAFAGHTLRFRDESWSADGNPWDFCDGATDDALRFLNAVLEAVPGADEARVVAFGGSRGGTVALLAALRDERVRRAISMAGPTDFFDLSLMRHENAYALYGQWLVSPSLEGTGSASDSRARLLRASPLLFADDLPPVQLHHGTADRNLPDEQTRRLARVLEASGRTTDEVYFYEG